MNFILSEESETIDNDPWERSAEIHEFVHHERHDTCCQDIVLHIGIPCVPQSLEDIEMDIVFRDLLEGVPVSLRARSKEGGTIPIAGFSMLNSSLSKSRGRNCKENVHFGELIGPAKTIVRVV